MAFWYAAGLFRMVSLPPRLVILSGSIPMITGMRNTLWSRFNCSRMSWTEPISTPRNLTGAPTRRPFTDPGK